MNNETEGTRLAHWLNVVRKRMPRRMRISDDELSKFWDAGWRPNETLQLLIEMQKKGVQLEFNICYTQEPSFTS